MTGTITGTQSGITVQAAGASKLAFAQQPTTTTAGNAISPAVTVQVQDPYGNAVADSGATVNMTVSAGPGPFTGTSTTSATTSGAGLATFNNLVLDTSGTTYSLQAASSGLTSGTSGTFTVNAASATTLTVAGFTSPTAAGAAHNVIVTAKDAFGNTATGYTGTVHFTSTDPQATAGAGLPANYTFTGGDAGVHTFTNGVTLKTAGTQSITATDTVTGTITGTQSSISVLPGTTTTLVVSGFPSPVTAGTAHSVIVTAQDAYGNTTPGYTGTVHFTSTDGQATAGSGLPANYTFVAGDNGVHTFTNGVTLKTAGTQSITATDTVTGTITGTQSAISVLSNTAATLVVSAFPSPTTAGVAHSVTVTAHDAYGNVATGYTGTVHFTSTDGAAVLPANYTFTTGTGADNGVHTFTNGVTLKTVGTQSITATDTVTGTITGTQSAITVKSASITLVQQQTLNVATSGANVASVPLTLPSSITSGDALVLSIADQSSNGAVVSSVTETGATWTKATSTGSTGNGDAEIWYALNVPSNASTTITANLSASTNVQIANVSEWSGVATSGALDKTNNANTTTASISAGSVTPTVSGELIVSDAYLLHGNTTQPTPTNGFAPLSQSSGASGNYRGYAAYLVDGATSSISTTWTEPGGAGSWSAAIATFEP